MLNQLSLHKISIIIFLTLLIVASIFGYGTIHLTGQVNEINSSWISFKSQHTEKARLINSLHGRLGYGGMIHDFKNYILRKDFEHFVKLQQSMGAAQTIVKQYFALSSTPAEKLVLNDIQSMLDNYQAGVELVRDEISKGSKSQKIDNLVRIDDSLALRGLQVLHGEIIAEHEYFNDKQQKPVLAADLRIELGYGGMIHSFKNYILRKEKKYREKALSSIINTENIINKYYQLSPSTGEKTALEDIQFVLMKYKKNIELIDKGIKNKSSPEEIDNQVKINDSYALRGLITLDQDIINQIEKKSERLTLMINNIIKVERFNGIAIIVFIILVAIFIFWFFSKKIILPVKNISEIMHEMAKGNLDVELDSYKKYNKNNQTELGKMDNSLRIFRENEKRRREAEEEIRKLALSDPLTGLANRNQFEKRYYEMVALAKRDEKPLAMLALDLDKFKPINDEYGHSAGDEILKAVASNLILAFRETDLIARLGGDEFAVILYAPENIESVEKAAKRVIALIPTPIVFGKDMLSVGISIGIALHSYEDEDNLELLMKNADNALYQAKEAGRNTYCVHEPELGSNSAELV